MYREEEEEEDEQKDKKKKLKMAMMISIMTMMITMFIHYEKKFFLISQGGGYNGIGVLDSINLSRIYFKVTLEGLD